MQLSFYSSTSVVIKEGSLSEHKDCVKHITKVKSVMLCKHDTLHGCKQQGLHIRGVVNINALMTSSLAGSHTRPHCLQQSFGKLSL